MAKGKPRHRDLPLAEQILKRREMFIRKHYGTELTELEKAEYLAMTKINLQKLGK